MTGPTPAAVPEPKPSPAAAAPLKDLDAATIDQAKDLGELVPVDVPEWGGRVYVRLMTSEERDQFERENLNLKSLHEQDEPRVAVMKNLRARLVAKVLCNAKGERLYPDFVEGARRIGARRAAVVNRLFEVASRLNVLTETDVEAVAGN